VPGFAGLGAPYWSPRVRGALIGLTAECGLPEIARATLEAVGYQTRDLVEAMAADAGVAVASLRVDGGMAASDWTMQFIRRHPAGDRRAAELGRDYRMGRRLCCGPRARPLP
jgi:glycerol kinase